MNKFYVWLIGFFIGGITGIFIVIWDENRSYATRSEELISAQARADSLSNLLLGTRDSIRLYKEKDIIFERESQENKKLLSDIYSALKTKTPDEINADRDRYLDIITRWADTKLAADTGDYGAVGNPQE